MADNLYLPQVDYTSKDYSSIRDDLIALIPNFAPQWTSRDPSDFGIVLVELFSYLGDLLNYNIDRAANEAFITTATQRDTVLNLANLLNYTPNASAPAVGQVTLTNSGTTAASYRGVSSATVASSATTLTTTSDGVTPAITFTIDSDVTVQPSSSATVNVTQGNYVVQEQVGTSDGTANQSYALANTGVMPTSSFVVYVNNLAWTKVNYTLDYDSTDNVYSVYTDGTGTTYVKFGDNVSGRIPPNGGTITVSYRYSNTLGSLGNIGAGTLTNISLAVPLTAGTTAPTGLNVAVTNASAFSGGADPETTDSIRVNAPLTLRAANRPVSLGDYANLAVQVSGVAKANAIANTYSSVALYIAANGGNTSTSAFKQTISDFFAPKIPPGTTLSVNDFTPGYPYIKVNVTVSPNYNASVVGAAVANALYTLLAFDNVSFNELVAQGDVYSAVRAVDGVIYAQIVDMEKFTAVYSGTATISNTNTSSSITVFNNTGLWVGAKIYSVNGSTTDSRVGLTISTLTNTDTALLSSSATWTYGDVIVVESAGTTVADLAFNINEVPILVPNYIRVTTTGGTS
jgi:hypothetical protein